MKITHQWLLDNRTKGGSWTKAQHNLLGLPWPPASKWMKRVQGMEIDEKTRIAFEKHAAKRRDYLDQIRGILPKLTSGEKEILKGWLDESD